MKNEITKKALRFWLEKVGMSQTTLAEKAGLSQGHITNMANGVRGITTENLEKICNAFEISIPEFFESRGGAPEIVFIERVKARPRAGTGGLETDGESAGQYSFHKSFIARKRGTPKSMKIFEVSGDSMEPTLADGDLIMINQEDRDIRTGHIYLLRLGAGEDSELMVKRLERRPGGVLLIRSDNPGYEGIPVNMNTIDGELEIFGRMVWSCREY